MIAFLKTLFLFLVKGKDEVLIVKVFVRCPPEYLSFWYVEFSKSSSGISAGFSLHMDLTIYLATHRAKPFSLDCGSYKNMMKMLTAWKTFMIDSIVIRNNALECISSDK